MNPEDRDCASPGNGVQIGAFYGLVEATTSEMKNKLMLSHEKLALICGYTGHIKHSRLPRNAQRKTFAKQFKKRRKK
jgi:hypothetical protein